MTLFKKKPKKYKPTDFVIVEKWGATFKTIDGEEHSFKEKVYIDPEAIRCSPSEWLMIDIKRDGYIPVGNNVYPLANIISIKWERKEVAISLRKWTSKAYEMKSVYYFEKNIEECKQVLSPTGKYDKMIAELEK